MTARIASLTANMARGGAETQVAHLATALSRGGWEVSVISLLPFSAFEEELASQGVAVYSLNMKPGRPSPVALARFLVLMRRLRPQILHGHMFHANLLARLIRAVCPVPVVISTLHSIIESGRESNDPRRREWLYRVTDRLADATVTVSAAGAERYAAVKAAPRAKLRVIPNGVDTSRFRPNEDTRRRMRRELGLGDEFVWLAVGRLMWKKDYPTMVRAHARRGQDLLLIAGAGPQESELRALVEQLGANVRFLGLREDIAALMNASDAVVLSSLIEGLPVGLLEAAASGLPMVATDVGGVKEIVLDGRTGYLVPAGDSDALSAAMARLASAPPEQRQGMGHAAREHAASSFDLAVVAAQWEQLYRELLDAARATGSAVRD